MNETTQQEKTTQLSIRNKQLNSAAGTKQLKLASRNETTQLVSRNETAQLCTAVDRLQPPATAYNRLQPPATACTAFTAESAFSTYCYLYVTIISFMKI
ncbi:hypothetical protein TNCV_2645671 [Trichonephila clavipes]|nr:hypothetical protein TNCV_2645671 [Trichonephila clavipes]